MGQPQKTNVIVTNRTNSAVVSQVALEITHLNMCQRLSGAVVILLMFWLAAVLLVLVPVLHFVLVPLALIGGIVAFIYKIRHRYRRSKMEIIGPCCQANVTLKKGTFNWPIYQMCYECRIELKMTQSSPSRSNATLQT